VELGSIFLILALLVIVVLLISRPFFTRKASPENSFDTRLDRECSNLLAERDRILVALQELDFDFTLGKIPGESYTPQRTRLVRRGAEVLRRLDSITSTIEEKDQAIDKATWDGVSINTRQDEQDVETEILGTDRVPSSIDTASTVKPIVNFPDDEFEVLLAKRRRDRWQKSIGFCPSCGDPVRKLDRYCPKCGAKTD